MHQAYHLPQVGGLRHDFPYIWRSHLILSAYDLALSTDTYVEQGCYRTST